MLRELLSLHLHAAGFDVVELGDGGDDLPRPFSTTYRVEVAVVALSGLRSEAGLSVVAALSDAAPMTRCLALATDVEGDEPLMASCFAAGAAGFLNIATSSVAELVRSIRFLTGRSADVMEDEGGERELGGRLLGKPSSCLTIRELEVLSYVVTGSDNLKMSAHLGITERTVRAHMSSLYRKLDCENRTQLALKAMRMQIRPAADA